MAQRPCWKNRVRKGERDRSQTWSAATASARPPTRPTPTGQPPPKPPTTRTTRTPTTTYQQPFWHIEYFGGLLGRPYWTVGNGRTSKQNQEKVKQTDVQQINERNDWSHEEEERTVRKSSMCHSGQDEAPSGLETIWHQRVRDRSARRPGLNIKTDLQVVDLPVTQRRVKWDFDLGQRCRNRWTGLNVYFYSPENSKTSSKPEGNIRFGWKLVPSVRRSWGKDNVTHCLWFIIDYIMKPTAEWNHGNS